MCKYWDIMLNQRVKFDLVLNSSLGIYFLLIAEITLFICFRTKFLFHNHLNTSETL